jgi:hypothetical protein
MKSENEIVIVEFKITQELISAFYFATNKKPILSTIDSLTYFSQDRHK